MPLTPKQKQDIKSEILNEARNIVGLEKLTFSEQDDLIYFIKLVFNKSYSQGYTDANLDIVNKINEEFSDDYSISYSPDVDITELPEGLIAEMNGVKKGIKVVKDYILNLANPF